MVAGISVPKNYLKNLPNEKSSVIMNSGESILKIKMAQYRTMIGPLLNCFILKKKIFQENFKIMKKMLYFKNICPFITLIWLFIK